MSRPNVILVIMLGCPLFGILPHPSNQKPSNPRVMHELSIIHSIIETVEATVAEQDAPVEVERVLLQVGDLAGVEIENLEFLWPAAVQDTILQQATCVIERVNAHAVCLDCHAEFSLKNYFDACPACGSFWKDVTAGEELKIKSIELCVQPADAVATATN